MQNKQKNITILGSTGSIGQQALEVLEALDAEYSINYLTVNNNIDILYSQIEKYRPKGIAIRNEDSYYEFKKTYSFDGEILCGREGVIELASRNDNDLVLSSLVGFAGVRPTLAAIEQGIDIALANKETLVSAGKVITDAAKRNNVNLLAVDSEHSAVLQCLAGEQHEEIEKIILTASGGPFLKTPMEQFETLSVEQALNHPNWEMGNKITIDSATMMNKGFEIIEAYWLFDVEIDKIDVVIHPQSIIHSMVQFVDGSVKAQLGVPDMKIPIAYALTFPRHAKSNFDRLDLTKIGSFDFIKPDFNRYKCLKLAYDSIEMGGNASAILNAANEIAVYSFLNREISFLDIPKSIEYALNTVEITENPSLDDIIASDMQAREITKAFIDNL